MTFWQSTPKLAGLSALSEILTYRWGSWLAVAVDKRNLQNSGWNRIRTEVGGVGCNQKGLGLGWTCSGEKPEGCQWLLDTSLQPPKWSHVRIIFGLGGWSAPFTLGCRSGTFFAIIVEVANSLDASSVILAFSYFCMCRDIQRWAIVLTDPVDLDSWSGYLECWSYLLPATSMLMQYRLYWVKGTSSDCTRLQVGTNHSCTWNDFRFDSAAFLLLIRRHFIDILMAWWFYVLSLQLPERVVFLDIWLRICCSHASVHGSSFSLWFVTSCYLIWWSSFSRARVILSTCGINTMFMVLRSKYDI